MDGRSNSRWPRARAPVERRGLLVAGMLGGVVVGKGDWLLVLLLGTARIRACVVVSMYSGAYACLCVCTLLLLLLLRLYFFLSHFFLFCFFWRRTYLLLLDLVRIDDDISGIVSGRSDR